MIIEDKNSIIAQFMGFIDNGCAEEGFLIHPVTNIDVDISDLSYDSDWNWLMDVVEKIESMNYDINIYGGCWVIIKDVDPNRNENDEIVETSEHSKIITLHEAVYQFIIWYNNQTK